MSPWFPLNRIRIFIPARVFRAISFFMIFEDIPVLAGLYRSDVMNLTVGNGECDPLAGWRILGILRARMFDLQRNA